MFETQQTHNANPSGSEGGHVDAMVNASAASHSQSTDASSQVDALQLIKEATGREFKSVEEGKTYLSNLNRLVGDNTVASQRKKAELADAVVAQYASEQGITEQEAEQQLRGIVQPRKQQQVNRSVSQEVQRDPRLDEMEQELLLSKNPEAAPYLDKVVKYARSESISLKQAYNDLYGEVIKTQREQSQAEALALEKKGAQVSASNSAPPSTENTQLKKLYAEYQRTGKSEIMREILKMRNGLK